MNTPLGIQSLVGAELSEVAFVRDYVELHFDGPVIRALTRPFVESNGTSTRFPTPGSRDALCSLIGQVVETVTETENVSVRVLFRNGSAFVVPLDPDSYEGPEAMHFQIERTALVQVWN